jgi:hypothetical protein
VKLDEMEAELDWIRLGWTGLGWAVFEFNKAGVVDVVQMINRKSGTENRSQDFIENSKKIHVRLQ